MRLGLKKRTRQVPWIKLVDIDLSDDGNWDRHGGDLLGEVMKNEFLICGVETEAGGKRRLRVVHGCR